jgi:hypothetical protein
MQSSLAAIALLGMHTGSDIKYLVQFTEDVLMVINRMCIRCSEHTRSIAINGCTPQSWVQTLPMLARAASVSCAAIVRQYLHGGG